jgi:hypothetical protein
VFAPRQLDRPRKEHREQNIPLPHRRPDCRIELELERFLHPLRGAHPQRLGERLPLDRYPLQRTCRARERHWHCRFEHWRPRRQPRELRLHLLRIGAQRGDEGEERQSNDPGNVIGTTNEHEWTRMGSDLGKRLRFPTG